jgi:thymidylate synthase (FAD)
MWEVKQNEIARLSEKTYQWALSKGIAKEQARAVLPEGMTVSRMYMNGTLRSWVHYLQLRTGNGTQKEHREIALECANEISKVFPMISELL